MKEPSRGETVTGRDQFNDTVCMCVGREEENFEGVVSELLCSYDETFFGGFLYIQLQHLGKSRRELTTSLIRKKER